MRRAGGCPTLAVAALGLALGLGGCMAGAPKRLELRGPGPHDLERGPASQRVAAGEAAGAAEVAPRPDGTEVGGPAAAPAEARGVEFGGAPPASAPAAGLPAIAAAGLEVERCRAPRCTREVDATPGRLVREQVTAPALVELEKAGTTCTFVFRPLRHPSPCCEPPDRGGLVYGVVLRGGASLRPHRWPACPRHKVCQSPPGGALPTWSAFRFPAGYELTATQDATLVALVHVPPEASGHGGDRPEIVDARQVAPQVRPDGIEVRSLFDLTGGAAAMAVLRAPAAAALPPHQHDQWWELVLVLGGEGALGVAAAPDERKLAPHAVAPGAAFAIPPRVRHSLTLRRRDPFIALQLRVPVPR